jgi:hypothetical protein
MNWIFAAGTAIGMAGLVYWAPKGERAETLGFLLGVLLMSTVLVLLVHHFGWWTR